MNLTHDGLTLWYGTPDAPAPFDGEVVPRAGVSLVLGVHPARPTNSVSVSYRVDGGGIRTVPGCELRSDYARNIQYYRAVFPRFVAGERVEYWPLLQCAGRQVPPARWALRFGGHFLLEPNLPARVARG